MAELCARQGRTADALAIYRQPVAAATDDERRARLQRRFETLEAVAAARAAAPATAAVGSAAAAAAAPATAPAEPPPVRLPLTVRLPVRSGQVVYAEGGDLVVLA